MNVEFDGDPALSGVNAICAFTGWTRRELAHRLGVGEAVLRYYERDGGPPWLTHALAGIVVLDLGLTVEHARELLEHTGTLPLLSADSDSR
jgi:transcriptional regulator with XRE-family HTH domain